MKWIAFLTVLASALLVQAADNPNSSLLTTRPKMGIQDDPNLPRVLVIGDSISVGYTAPLRQALAGKANLHRIRDNAGSTTNGLSSLKRWLGKDKWDLIYFNFGLHDLRVVGDGHVATPEEYEKNLEQIVQQLKKTGAKLAWATTTPVPAGKLTPPRKSEDIPIYNAVAKKVMDKNGIPIHDLYAFALPKLQKLQVPNNVHFNPEGSEALGQEIAAYIVKTLGPPAAK